MWEFREQDENRLGQDALTLVLGAAGGFAVGMLLSGRGSAGVRQLGGNLRERADLLRERARTVASRLRPARLRRATPAEAGLTELEDAVLDALLSDEVLSERGIDVGAISQGIIELSGSVFTEEEAHRVVALVRNVPGVSTVVNRMDVEDDGRRHSRWPLRDDDAAREEREWTGLRMGMGRRRQGRETDPSTNDSSHDIIRGALDRADAADFEWEGYAANPRMAERPEDDRGRELNYSEDELDNQEPVGPNTYGGIPKEPGQVFHSQARVGEGPKPGEELRLEAADVPVKPHGDYPHGSGAEGTGGEHR